MLQLYVWYRHINTQQMLSVTFTAPLLASRVVGSGGRRNKGALSALGHVVLIATRQHAHTHTTHLACLLTSIVV